MFRSNRICTGSYRSDQLGKGIRGNLCGDCWGWVGFLHRVPNRYQKWTSLTFPHCVRHYSLTRLRWKYYFYVILSRFLLTYIDSFPSPFWCNMHWMCIFIFFSTKLNNSHELGRYTSCSHDHQQISLTKLIPCFTRSVETLLQSDAIPVAQTTVWNTKTQLCQSIVDIRTQHCNIASVTQKQHQYQQS